jgi:DNA gyrase/topoisomerase IV subunit A
MVTLTVGSYQCSLLPGADGVQVLVVTEKGYGKCVPATTIRSQRRGGKGAILMRFKPSMMKAKSGRKGTSSQTVQGEVSSEGAVQVGAFVAGDAISNIRACGGDDEVIISTSKGTVTRQKIAAISVQSRRATGVVLQSFDQQDEHVVSVDIVHPV